MERDSSLARRVAALWILLVTVAYGGCDSRTAEISAQALLSRLKAGNGPVVIDVRSQQEYRGGHVPGAINLPHTEVAAHLDELQPYRDRAVVLYCKSGRRAAIAKKVLSDAGFTRLFHLSGDMDGWRRDGLPVE